jgi:nucleotide-binding universal stress UspA family protein
MLKHIVVGCDGTDGARDAVALAGAIAPATGATLSLLGVFPPAVFPVPSSTDRRTLRQQAEMILRRQRDELAPDARIDTVVDISVPRALRHYAERWHARLVVIGSHKSAPVGHVVIGRRGRQLLYDAPFSLALAPRGLHARTTTLGTIGVGYDGGAEAQEALAMAAEIAQASGARLHARRVVEDRIPALSLEKAIVTDDWGQLWEGERQSAEFDTQSAVASLEVATEVSATIGDPGYELRAFSEQVDLLVVGSRRWGPIARLISGGVGETLVADASCAIGIVPRPHPQRRAATPPLRKRVAA